MTDIVLPSLVLNDDDDDDDDDDCSISGGEARDVAELDLALRCLFAHVCGCGCG